MHLKKLVLIIRHNILYIYIYIYIFPLKSVFTSFGAPFQYCEVIIGMKAIVDG